MSAVIEVCAAVAIVGYTVGRQLAGEALRGRRVVVLPIALTVIGVVDLHSSAHHVGPADVACLVADGVDAKAAAATSTILLMLGVNRLAQAGVILLRAMSSGIPFAPEKDGRSLLSGLTQEAGRRHGR